MVLEDDSSSDSDSYADNDPSRVQVGPGIYVDLNSLPRMLGRSGHPRSLVQIMRNTYEAGSAQLQRPISQDEMDVLAYQWARATRLSSFAPPIGMAIAAVPWYRGMHSYRFPAWTPGPTFDPERFFGVLRGRSAVVAWQALRATAYSTLLVFACQLVLSSVAVQQLTNITDPRLANLKREAAEAHRREREEKLRTAKEGDHTPAPRDGETLEMARQRQQVQERWRRSNRAQPTSADDNDASATAKFSGDAPWNGDGQQDTVYGGDNMAYVAENQTSSNADNASPTASTDHAGSAWDRIREQAASGNARGQPRAADAASSSEDDGIGFFAREDDVSLARSQAQKRFDARVERERKGKDFDDNDDDNNNNIRRGNGGWRS